MTGSVSGGSEIGESGGSRAIRGLEALLRFFASPAVQRARPDELERLEGEARIAGADLAGQRIMAEAIDRRAHARGEAEVFALAARVWSRLARTAPGVKAQALARAEANLARATLLRPQDAASFALMGWVLERRGRPQEAIEAWRVAHALEPSQRQHRVGLAVALCGVGRYRDAVPHFREAADATPDRAEAWLNLGLACREAGELEEAVEAFDQAARLDPSSPRTHVELGIALRGAGRQEAALHAFERALQLDPSNVDALHQKGRALWRMEREEEALAVLRSALVVDPDRPEVQASLDELQGPALSIEEDTDLLPMSAPADLEVRLESFGVPEVLEFLGHSRRSGRLELLDAVLEMEDGRLVAGWVEGLPSFADRLVDRGIDLSALEPVPAGASVEMLLLGVLAQDRAQLSVLEEVCFESSVETVSELLERKMGFARFFGRAPQTKPGSSVRHNVGAETQGVLLEAFRRLDEAGR